ncbi:3-oxoadipate enol-lactonase [Hypericibacter terrae]|jgi:3-oxoadipate enol-lactonase|uniref:3-oxoadipate enol-lactonase n=1 Tax=Hypericibacter terrae TaxID=2602015 RepID=A0A5J6MK51_9PROT|nr:3-oxoadipate enol-lactonase [Hypericibacter terrae]QEX17753.1 3-oxoadipate enol-lactonase [Hypericibacter terrae]
MGTSEGILRCNGADLAYRMDGPAGRPILLFSNSLASDMSIWDDQVAALKSDYRIVRYDTRGHGRSPVVDGPLTIDDLASDAIALIEQLALGPVHFVGISLGGMLGQAVAARRPDLLRSLTLSNTSSETDKPELWEPRIQTALTTGMAPLVEPTLERWFTAPFRASQPQRVETVRRMIAATPPKGYAACARAIQGLRQTAILARIVTPTLVIAGREDASTPVAVAERIAHAIKGAKLVVVEQAAHITPIEQADKFNQHLRHFLAAAAKHSSSGAASGPAAASS